MAELKLAYEADPKNPMADWAVRIGVAVVYVLFGTDKFGSDAHWVKLFQEIGFGDWFRYFTGMVEVLGGLLVLIPRTAMVGLTMLIVTMIGAVVLLCRLGHAGDSVFPGIFLIALTTIAFTRWSAARG